MVDMNQHVMNNIENFNQEQFTEQNIRVYEPEDKEVEGEFDYMHKHTNFNVNQPDMCQIDNIQGNNFVNIAPFPTEFASPEDALTSYNEYGLWNKMQFKMGYKRFGKGKGNMYCFHLICACKKFDECKNIKQGVDLYKKDA